MLDGKRMLYHSSATTNRTSILANGLLTKADRSGMLAVFLADVPEHQKNLDLWQVDVEGLHLEDDNTTSGADNWFMSFQDIAPARLTLLPKA